MPSQQLLIGRFSLAMQASNRLARRLAASAPTLPSLRKRREVAARE
jgi:hypothetical protein